MEKNPFELRHAIISQLIATDEKSRKLILDELDDFTVIVKHMDKLTSGKYAEPSPAVIEPNLTSNSSIDNFKLFVSNQKINHPSGAITPTFFDWYPFEFARLQNARIGNQWSYDQAVFHRLKGITTFIMLYGAYMKSLGKDIGILVHNHGTAIELKNRCRLTISSKIIDFTSKRGSTHVGYDQIICDNTKLSFIDRFAATDNLHELRKVCKSGIVNYTTAELGLLDY